ncbi:hypothetical protein B1209_12550 [Raoultella planticola]|jgi:hypothetical protein|nr:DUF4222 domain-containing protein [Raoultella ornithinolytica]ARS97883.1 hypothetical protein B8O09_01285 [Klebsiella pneumoniae]AUU06374.1 hypothetical protein MC50_022310 [Raoultella planticola]HDX8331717.1 DUF4222 domain-containing protein [Raoultella ornithinolytica CD1_MRS_4]AUV53513.1 hypothetical protein B1209_12550 [Raoultella planticola]EJD6653656.1 DUF4222 domain-containing protein [Raoultella ornithinolytica]
MCNPSAAELIARLKKAYPAHVPADRPSNSILKPGARFKHGRRGYMVTVIIATEKDVSYRKACGTACWMGLREFLRQHNEVSV